MIFKFKKHNYNLYNTLLHLSRNIYFYKSINIQDTFESRIYLMFMHYSIILIIFFDKLKIPAALLAGTLVASGFLQITDIASYKLPDNIINYCLLILGASVGCRFANKTFKEIA